MPPPKINNNATLNNGLLRALSIDSMDMLSFKAMLVDDPISQRPADVAMRDLIEGGLVQGAKKARKSTKDASHSRSGVLTLGSAHTDALLHGTGDGGLTYLQAVALQRRPLRLHPV